MAQQSISRVLTGLAFALVSATAIAQTPRVVASIDMYRYDNLSGESRHEILPVAVYADGRFLPAVEWNQTYGANSRRPFLLTNYRNVQVLHRGNPVGEMLVRDVHTQYYKCSAPIVGSGDYTALSPLPPSDVTGGSSGTRNGEAYDYSTAAYLALSGALEQVNPSGASFIMEVTDPAELAGLTNEIDTAFPQPDLLPLSVDETGAWRFDRHGAVLAVRRRQAEAPIVGPAGIDLPGPMHTDIVVIRTNAGPRSLLALPGSPMSQDAFGKGPEDRFIDAFELANGNLYFLFHRHNYEAWQARLYELRPNRAPTLAVEVGLYGC